MDSKNNLPQRKTDHIRINLENDVKSSLTNGLDGYHFVHQALPEIDLAQISLKTSLFGKPLAAPFQISSMTGGTSEALLLNQRLAAVAQEFGIAMGVGSQRAAIENCELEDSFRVRDIAPDILLFANLGAIQLNFGYSATTCQKAVDMIEADGLILHLNPLQEALQPQGETNFSGLAKEIEKVCRRVSVPVVVKEVGWGISEDAARMLVDAGVSAIDVAGAGGTSWSQVEMYRIDDPYQAQTAAVFRNWGIPTADSILAARRVSPNLPVIASGGIKDGVDAAKCLALGANLCGLAGQFLKAAAISVEDAQKTAIMLIQQMKIAMFSAGVSELSQLNAALLKKR
ncbi:MAG: type 2 isopentenyl-diphosphate Delta-isomerase [Anaerolineaceae bacterium]|nr:type 2 isopentenyl-diphosphate Delta-isomerase [Anaerolineaceae bacterium]